MSLFLTIVIGCICALLLVIGVGFLIISYFVGRSILCNNADATPLVLHLNESLLDEWITSKKTIELIEQFTALGFRQGKTYTIPEFSDTQLVSLFSEHLIGVIYEHPDAGYFVDMVHAQSNDQFLTVTTAPLGEEMDDIPGVKKFFLTNASVQDIHEKIHAEMDESDSLNINDENFREYFEQCYKYEQSYRYKNGGVSFEEFQKTAAKLKKKLSDKEIRSSYIELKESEIDMLNEAGLQEYFEQNNIDLENQYDHSYFSVPHKTDAAAFVHYLSSYCMVDYEQVEKVADAVKDETDIVALFAKINNARSPAIRAEKVTSVTFPVDAEIYRLAV